MKYVLAWLGVAILSIGALLCVVWAVQGNQFFLYKVFAPAEEQVRREVFEQSKAYNQGMSQEIGAMQFEYIKATPSQQDALASVILHRVADYDLSRFPADLRQFVEQLKRDRENAR